jgi:hypothetical protein
MSQNRQIVDENDRQRPTGIPMAETGHARRDKVN